MYEIAEYSHPGDDFDDFANGKWRANTQIPDDETRWGSFIILRNSNLDRLKEICEKDHGIVGQLYTSLMQLKNGRSETVRKLVERVLGIKDHREYLSLAGELFTYGIRTLMHVCKTADDKDPDTYVPRIHQSGLGLPDMSYYTEREDVHSDYLKYVKFACGYYDVDVDAQAFFSFEKEIASHYFTNTQLRDRDLTYNKLPYSEVQELLPEYFKALNLPAMTDIIVTNPELLKFLSVYLSKVPVETLRTHLVFHIVNNFAEVDADDLVNAMFEFYGKKLNGQKQLRPLWKRRIDMMNMYVGDELGKLYVEKYFPEAKQRLCSEMVQSLLKVLAEIIDNQDWMSAETKEEAQRKLSKLGTDKIGAPKKYHTTEGLWNDSVPIDSVTALMEWGIWDWTHEECRLFYTKVDRELWDMTPQTVNAYYSPVMSEIVFPAGILQPPFFGEDMVECLGGIGVVIGHEMTHAFDDEGRKYNADGELKDWWSANDSLEFEKRTKTVEEHYSRQVMFGKHVDGKLTLGENIADIGGLKIALRALRKHYRVVTTDMYDRFFRAYAKVWGFIIREETAKKMLVIDPHAPPSCRINVALAHVPEFYETYDVQEHHKMYLPPDQRMNIW